MAWHHGTMPRGNGGGPPEEQKRARRPSGEVKIDEGEAPIPIIMSSGFFLRIIGIILVPTIAAIGAGVSMYYKASAHIERVDIHQDSSLVETKKDAQMARGKLLDEIKDKVSFEIDKVRLEQKVHINKIGDELKLQQRDSVRRIIDELKKTRRIITDQ